MKQKRAWKGLPSRSIAVPAHSNVDVELGNGDLCTKDATSAMASYDPSKKKKVITKTNKTPTFYYVQSRTFDKYIL